VIIAPNCATSSCHSAGAAAAGLDLSDAVNAYISLVDASKRTSRAPGLSLPAVEGMRDEGAAPRVLVHPFNPTQSRLARMLRADGAPRMPPERFLPLADIELIEKWILEGAREN
jgi:hypothetical protein